MLILYISADILSVHLIIFDTKLFSSANFNGLREAFLAFDDVWTKIQYATKTRKSTPPGGGAGDMPRMQTDHTSGHN